MDKLTPKHYDNEILQYCERALFSQLPNMERKDFIDGLEEILNTAEDEGDWVRNKLELPQDATLQDIQKKLHVVYSRYIGYEKYIESYKCEDKQGEIARLTAKLEDANTAEDEPRRKKELRFLQGIRDYWFEQYKRILINGNKDNLTRQDKTLLKSWDANTTKDEPDCPNCECNVCLGKRQVKLTRPEIDEIYLKYVSSKGKNQIAKRKIEEAINALRKTREFGHRVPIYASDVIDWLQQEDEGGQKTNT